MGAQRAQDLHDLYMIGTGKECDYDRLAIIHDKFENMVNGRRFLFVLDDLWTDRDKDWEKLKAPLGQCAVGSVVLVSARNQGVLKTMNSEGIHKLGVLEGAHWWDLFRQKAFRQKNRKAGLEDIAWKIVEKCKGVPLAVKVLGSILCGIVDKGRWLSTLESKFWDFPVQEDDISPALRLSFHCLPFHLKLCFEYFSLFPTDYTFDKSMLVQSWIAEGLVHPQPGREIEDVGSDYYDELQERSLIEFDNKVHDLIHSLACQVSRKFYSGEINRSTSGNTTGKTRHFSFFDVKRREVELPIAARSLRTFVSIVYSPICRFDLKPFLVEISRAFTCCGFVGM